MNSSIQNQQLQAENSKLKAEKAEYDRTNYLETQKQNNDNMRLTENNTYYSQVYHAKVRIFLLIVVACLPLILIGILKQRYLLTTNISAILAVIIIIIALVFIIPAIMDMYGRDNMNYDEYQFPFNPLAASNPKIDLNPNLANMTISRVAVFIAECIGKDCCTNLGLTYDSVNKKCIVQASSSIKEGFLSGQSTQDSGSLFNSKTADKSLIAIDMSGKYYSL